MWCEISLRSTDLGHDLELAARLGFAKVEGHPSDPYPWAMVTDGEVFYGIHQDPSWNAELGEGNCVLTHFGDVAERVATLRERGIEPVRVDEQAGKAVRAHWRDPNGTLVQTFALTSSPEPPSGASRCGTFGELYTLTDDLPATLAFWEALGFTASGTYSEPYPWAILSDGHVRIGLHQRSPGAGEGSPSVAYFAGDMDARREQLAAEGVAFSGEKGWSVATSGGFQFQLFHGDL